MKSGTIITVVIILVLAGTWYWTQAQEQQQEFVKEHNIKLSEYNKLMKEHNQLINNYNTEINPELELQKAKAYLNWLDQHEKTIIDFKSHVEINDERLKKAEVNPDYMRDDVKTSLTSMRENRASVQSTVASIEAHELYGKFKTKASKYLALSKERAQFITSYELETNPEVRLQIVKNYLDWINQNEDSIIDYKSYLETNSESLTKAGFTPDELVDIVNKALMTLQEDRANVQIMIADTIISQRLMAESGTS
jgi:hypothetical protein